MAFNFNPFTGNLDLVKDTPPAGNNTEIQFNNNGAFGSSPNLTFDGTLDVKGAGSTSATQTLSLKNSTDENLFTMNDDGTIDGKNISFFGSTTKIGIGAMSLNTGVFNNVAIGSAAAENNTTGVNFIAIGTNAARFNQTGNSFTAIGPNCGRANVTGNFWTSIGTTAAFNNLYGDNWLAIGYNAARYNTGGSNLVYFTEGTYLGSQCRGTNGTFNNPTVNETVIGYATDGNGSNTVTIGSTSVVGTYLRGTIFQNGTTIHASDLALKQDVNQLKGSLEKLKKISGVSFSWKKEPSNTNIGLIAQEVNYQFPEAVQKNEDGYLGVSYVSMIAPIIEAIKELDQKIETLSKKIGV